MDWQFWARKHQHRGLDVDGSPRLEQALIGKDAANSFEVLPSGQIVQRGTSTTWMDINFPFSSAKLPAANYPDWTLLYAPFYAYTFKVNDVMQLTAQEIPHTWAEGTSISIHVHILTNGVDTSKRYLKQTISYLWANPLGDGNGATAASTLGTITYEFEIPANTPTRTHLVYNVGDISGAGMKIGSYLGLHFKRVTSAGTAPTNNPFILAVGVHHQVNTLGSLELYKKGL